MKIKKGDQVKIISGKERGKTGNVVAVFPSKNLITVENLNLVIRHRRSRKQGQKGEKVRMAMPIHASNAMIICGSCKAASRTGIKIMDGKKFRVCKKCGTEL